MNIILLQKFIEKNDPKGKEKLAAKAELSLSLLNKILKDGHEPGIKIARRIAETLGVSLDKLCNSEGKNENRGA